MEKETKGKLSKWLEMLQQESWQLELLISGFAIFLILGTYDSLQDLRIQIRMLSVSSQGYGLLMIPQILLQWAWYVLLTNLIIHVLFRGLWISTIGLRYVSGDIDFEQLSFQPRFDRFLRKSIKSFDSYIEQLEKVCSIIFAFTFLMIFMLISLGLFFGFTILLSSILQSLFNANAILGFIFFIVFFLCQILALIYFIDFFTLGSIKRIKWFSKIYYPIYRFFSWITLAAIYRPLYYNMIDNKFGKWMAYATVPYMIIVLVLMHNKVETHGYMVDSSGQHVLNTFYYEDQRSENSVQVEASIPSKYVKNGYIELFMPYNPGTDDRAIKLLCPELNPAKSTGFKSTLRIGGKRLYGKTITTSPADSIMLCMNQFHKVYVDDSLYQNLTWRFYDHPKRRDKGLITMLDVNHLDRGEHFIRTKTHFASTQSGKDSLIIGESVFIPFWIE